MKSITVFDKINKISLYLAVFLIPLFFLPLAQDFLEYPKQIIILILLLIGLGAWFLKQIAQGKIVIKKNSLIYSAIILLLISSFLSALFSLWRKASFFGFPLDIADSFISLVIFAFLAFLIANSFQNEKEVLFLMMLLLLSGALAGIFTILQLYNIYIFPLKIIQSASFNTIGTVHSVSVLSAILLSISLFSFFKTTRFKKIISGLAAFVFLLTIIIINFKTAWSVLIFITVLLFLFGLRDARGGVAIGWIISTMIVLIISIFFLFFPYRFPVFPNIPLEVSPSFSSEIDILRGVFSGGPKNILLGTGPGTFIFDYSKFRSPLLNQTVFWGNRFSRGDSIFFDWVITKGIAGGVAVLFLIGAILYILFREIGQNNQTKPIFLIKPAFFSSMVGMLFLGFFYAFNFVLWFLMWIFIGIFLYCEGKEKTEFKLEKFTFKTTGITFLFLIIFLLGLAIFFSQGKRYIADINYVNGIKSSQAGNIDQAIFLIKEKAIELSPGIDIYWRDLGQLYLAKANLISQDANLTPEQKPDLIKIIIAKGIEAVEKAVDISPANVANWNVRGFFYRSLTGIEGAGERALESYRKAIELEPASPFAQGEMGRVYVLIAQDFVRKQMEGAQKETLSLAIKSLNRALELKPDYAPAHYLLAVVYDQQGNIDEAIRQLKVTKSTAMADAGVAFQLGLLYWRKNEIDRAQKEFKQAVELYPQFSNAQYMLGLAYDAMNLKEEARQQFEKVGELNPDNEEVKKIIDNLQRGLPALKGVVVSQPPIQESPPEIQR